MFVRYNFDFKPIKQLLCIILLNYDTNFFQKDSVYRYRKTNVAESKGGVL